MPIHIGQILESIAAQKGLTQKQVGALINKHEKTVADIYKREAISTDLLLSFCTAFNMDLFNLFYEEELLKSFRRDETTKLNNRIQRLNEKNQNLTEKLDLAMLAIESNKKVLMLKDILERLVPQEVFIQSMNELEKNYKPETNLPMAQEDKKQDESNS